MNLAQRSCLVTRVLHDSVLELRRRKDEIDTAERLDKSSESPTHLSVVTTPCEAVLPPASA
jgi:hypothetical protein